MFGLNCLGSDGNYRGSLGRAVWALYDFARGNDRSLGIARCAKAIERPGVHPFDMAKNVEIPVVGSHTKVHNTGGIPAVFHFRDLERPPA